MNESKQTPKERAAAFVGNLRRIRNDRGKLAALRRGLTNNPRMHVDAWPIVASLGGDIAQPIFVTVAALFATHAKESKAHNFGATCLEIACTAHGHGKNKIPDSFGRRFRRLLASDDVEDVTGQLRSWIRLAAGKEVGVNYESLLFDLMLWNKYADDIRVRWAKSFWQSGENSSAEPPTVNPINA
jgi:CRISPR type I-E-associated protein CasB/Cse2